MGGMRPDLDILRKLIKDKALVTVEEDWPGKERGKKNDKKFFLKLKEPVGKESSGYEIKILNTPEDTIAIKSDMFSFPEKIFRSTRGEGKRADYVIIASDGEKNWIVYIEMKRGKHGQGGHIVQQLQGSKCFIDYCRTVVQTFWRESSFLEEKDYQQRYVSVENIDGKKRPIRKIRNPSSHNCPENMLKISSPAQKGIWFRELVGSAN